MADSIAPLRDNLEKVILGKPQAVEHLLIALIAGGHVLMEDVPGVGKTTLARALSLSVEGRFSRIQFTPDLLPADVLGVSIYNASNGEFEFKEGPVFANVLLADEINRASPRTQSALLQAMSEARATVDGETYELAPPFMVIATQNPVEFHGTYPLPEAQLDRFMVRFSMGYPDSDAEFEMLTGQKESHPLTRLESVATFDDLNEMRKEVRKVKVSDDVTKYILALIKKTREEARFKLGSSPRGSLAMYKATQARAFSQGRDYVTPDDVKALAHPVLAHRVILETKTRYSGDTAESILSEHLADLAVPV